MNAEIKKYLDRAIGFCHVGENYRAFVCLHDAVTLLNDQGNNPTKEYHDDCHASDLEKGCPEKKPLKLTDIFCHCKKCGTNFQAGMIMECPACKAQIEHLEIREPLHAISILKPLTLGELKRQVDAAIKMKEFHEAGWFEDGQHLGFIGEFEIRRRN